MANKIKKKKATNSKNVPIKDQKILWSRAAGRCSFNKCKNILTLIEDDISSFTLGAMCHIVAKEKDGPRGSSSLTLKERNTFHNLILLCSHHHDIIDNNTKKYTIEYLHKIKYDHELWVNEKLSGPDLDPDDLVIANIIDTITASLNLENWNWFTDHAIRDLFHKSYFKAWSTLNKISVNPIWPKKHIKLVKAIKSLLDSFNNYMVLYDSNCEERGTYFGADKSYARYFNKDYNKFVDAEVKWSNNCFWLLCDVNIKLNKFANAVREEINPMYYRLEGKFFIYDSMGTRFGGDPKYYLPSAKTVKENLDNYK